MYRINYNYVHKNGKLRAGSIISTKTDATEARAHAIELLNTEYTAFQITSVVPYITEQTPKPNKK